MSFLYRKRIRLSQHLGLNVSTHGVSVSARLGPITVNSRGRSSVRIGHGLAYRARLFR